MNPCRQRSPYRAQLFVIFLISGFPFRHKIPESPRMIQDNRVAKFMQKNIFNKTPRYHHQLKVEVDVFFLRTTCPNAFLPFDGNTIIGKTCFLADAFKNWNKPALSFVFQPEEQSKAAFSFILNIPPKRNCACIISV